MNFDKESKSVFFLFFFVGGGGGGGRGEGGGGIRAPSFAPNFLEVFFFLYLHLSSIFGHNVTYVQRQRLDVIF